MLEIFDGNEGQRLVFSKFSNHLMETGTGEATFFNYTATLIRWAAETFCNYSLQGNKQQGDGKHDLSASVEIGN